MSDPVRMTHAEWKAEGERRFGKDVMKWKFVCPVCQYVQSVEDYKNAGAEQTTVAFSCVGRSIEGAQEAFETRRKKGVNKGPCNYAGGGLFRLNPVEVSFPDGKTESYFAFAPAETEAAPAGAAQA